MNSSNYLPKDTPDWESNSDGPGSMISPAQYQSPFFQGFLFSETAYPHAV